MLSLEDVALRRRGRPVLERIQLTVRAHELVVVEGARGAGKSQLLAIAAAALRPHAGAVRIAGRNILDLQDASLPYVRRNLGYLPPDPVLIEHETVHENVLLPLAVRGVPIAQAEVRADLELARMGLSDLRDERVATLSPSEARLCAIARALIGAPVAVVLDEPCTGLDAASRAQVVAAMNAAREAGAALLCGSADPGFVAGLQAAGARRLTLSGGRLQGDGPRMRVVSPLDFEAGAGVGARPRGEEVAELDDADLEVMSVAAESVEGGA